MKRVLIVALSIMIMIILVLTTTELSPHFDFSGQNQQSRPSDFYVGVSFCGNTTAQAELLIDKVKDYTNLFVVQSGPVSVNETASEHNS